MALIKCKECGHEISRKADKCPHCGAPRKKSTSLLTWLVLILIVFGVYVVVRMPFTTSGEHVAGQPSAIAELDRSAEKQAERKSFIEGLIGRGILHKVEVPSELPHIYVAPGFYPLNVNDKQRFINVVYAYFVAQNPKADIATLYDSRSGKKIGRFTESGLDLD